MATEGPPAFLASSFFRLFEPLKPYGLQRHSPAAQQKRSEMIDPIDPIRMLGNPPALRVWLLHEAMRSVPLDRALELARTAEAFLMRAAVETTTDQNGVPATVSDREQERDQTGHNAVDGAPADG